MTDRNKKRGPTTQKLKQIPDFSSYQEEAKFWDTHDTTEYFESQPVKMKVAKDFKSTYRKDFKMSKQPSRGITVRFPVDVLAELRERAARLGVGPTTLARMWIMERLQALEGKSKGKLPRGGVAG